MTVLPKSRVVNVTVTREDSFPSIEGFGTPLIVTDETNATVNASARTKAYASIEEVALDWASSTEAYKAAQTMFSMRVTPVQIKIGFRANVSASSLATEMDALAAFDNNWYQIMFTKTIRADTADENAALAWIESKKKLGFFGCNEVGVKTVGSTGALPNRAKGQWDRSGVFYSEVAAEYPEAAMAAYSATRNFDQPDSAYTLKFKRGFGITTLNQASGVVQVITGFTPALGLDMTVGNYANVFVNVGGVLMFTEGNTLSGAFFDEIHFADWLIARTQEEILGILANAARVPMTDEGVEQIASGARAVLDRAYAAGLLAADRDDEDNRLPPYVLTLQRVRAISAAQRRQRIAPAIAGSFRYAGAVHYATVNFTMKF